MIETYLGWTIGLFIVGLLAYLFIRDAIKEYGLLPDERELLKTYLNIYGPTGADPHLCDIYEKGPHFLYKLPLRPAWFQIGAPGSTSGWNEHITDITLQELQRMSRRRALRFRIRVRRPRSSRYDSQYASFGSGPLELGPTSSMRTFIKRQRKWSKLKALPNTEEVINFIVNDENTK